MATSNPISNYEEYLAFMRGANMWTNLKYEPPVHERPTDYPFICIAEYRENTWNGRMGVEETWVALREFYDADIVAEAVRRFNEENEWRDEAMTWGEFRRECLGG